MNMNPVKRQHTILVADDDPAILDATSMILEDEGYNVLTSSNGNTVMDSKKNLPDLLLLDIWMSGKDGREICRQIKSTEQTKHIPVIMISANRDTEKIAKEVGAEDFITKPFDIDELLMKVDRHIKS
jgi:DNA-binding response OmpR family regulator